jgi:CRISPR-associated protein (TIGR02710 family)
MTKGDGDEFQARSARYFDILDGRATFDGEGDSTSQARKYWLAELAEPLIERLRDRLVTSGKLPERVGLLVSTAGFTPETTILMARALRPRRVIVISSGEAYDSIDIIGDHLLQHRLRVKDFEHVRCDPTDLSLFEVVRRAVEEHRRDEDAGEAIIDVTGGKKIMSAAAAMAAWELDLRVAYIDCRFAPSRRIATPGTEDIILLDSPSLRFGGEDVRRADQDFNSGAYEAARVRYGRLADRLSTPSRARFLRDLAAVYDAWRNLDLKRLKDALPDMRSRLDEPDQLARVLRPQVEAQLRFLERLIAEETPARVMTLLLLGDANADAGRNDFAALFFYRAMEASLAGRLTQRYPGFRCDAPDYAKIEADVAELKARILAAAKAVLPRGADAEYTAKLDVAAKLALMDCALVLLAVQDELFARAGMSDQRFFFSQLQGLATVRNRSILAHGYASVSKKNVDDLRQRARELVQAYWELAGQPEPFHIAEKQFHFARIPS